MLERLAQVRVADDSHEPDDAEVLARLDDRLSYSLTDWAITDRDVHQSLELIRSLAPDQRTRIIDQLRERGQLGRLLDNISDADRDAFADVIDSIPARDRIDELLDTGLLDWWVTDAEADEAMDILSDVPDDGLDTVVSAIDVETLVDNVPEGHLKEARRIYEVISDPADKARFWLLWYREHVGRRQADEGVPDAFMEETEALDEGEEAVDHLLDRYAHAIEGMTDRSRLSGVQRQYRRELEELDLRKRRELDLELDFGIPIQQENVSTFLNVGELDQLKQVYERLPPTHLEGITRVRRVDEEGGAYYAFGTDEIVIQDGGTSGRFRATGRASEIGGHTSLTPLIETLTHEIGHHVEDLDPETIREFERLAGWKQLDAGQMLETLVADGMSETDANALLDTMQAEIFDEDRKVAYESRSVHLTGDGRTLRANKYAEGTYWARTTNTIPGDPELSDNGLYGYANVAPGEHFAEMYTHMVNVPELIYEDYVSRPEEALAKARTDLEAARRELAKARIAGAADEEVARLEAEVEELEEDLDARKAQHDTLTAQWTFMRERVFGLTGDVESAAIDEITELARARVDGNGAMGPEAQAILERFIRQASMCATPEQLDRLKTRAQADLAAPGTP